MKSERLRSDVWVAELSDSYSEFMIFEAHAFEGLVEN